MAAVFVCFGRPLISHGAAGDLAWASAVLWRDGDIVASVTTEWSAAAAYMRGLLALHEGAILKAAARALPAGPMSCS